jgi:hypothetical protein
MDHKVQLLKPLYYSVAMIKLFDEESTPEEHLYSSGSYQILDNESGIIGHELQYTRAHISGRRNSESLRVTVELHPHEKRTKAIT